MSSEFFELCDVHHWGLTHGKKLLPSDLAFFPVCLFTSFVSSCVPTTLASPLPLELVVSVLTVVLIKHVFDLAYFRCFHYMTDRCRLLFCNFRMVVLFIFTVSGSVTFFLVLRFY